MNTVKVVKNGSRARRPPPPPPGNAQTLTQTCALRFRSSSVPRHLFAAVPDDNDGASMWSLPEELLVHLFRRLHVKDLLNMRSVHPAFRDLIDVNKTLWQTVRFDDTWPSVGNLKHFEKAAEHKNIESLLKLGIAYLYNEGLPHDGEGERMRSNGRMAAAMFCEVETLTPGVTPFTWLFIRPPWSAGRACCKECVFKNMLLYVKQHQDTSVALCVSQILRLFEDTESKTRMIRYLTLAADGGNKPAMYQLWMEKYQNKIRDKAMELQSARQLRDIASLGPIEAQLTLCRYYAGSQYSAAEFLQYCGVSRDTAVATVRQFLQSSTPTNSHLIFSRHPDISNTMRYILIDWLVEVAGMKDFCTHTLHVAVSVVDRFLRVHTMTRSRLQLLGVAAMVLCSRFLGRDIITIREAAWLTDNTYKYEDVVRMMGEVVATLQGKIRVLTCLDYLYVLQDLAQVEPTTRYLTEFACEMSLLHAELSGYKRAEIASSCLLLAHLIMKKEYPWPSQMQEFTGFTAASLTKCLIHLYSKCFVSTKVLDHREVELEAVRQRYNSEDFCSVSQIKLPSLEEICAQLGVSEHVFVDDGMVVRYKPISANISAESSPRSTPGVDNMKTDGSEDSDAEACGKSQEGTEESAMNTSMEMADQSSSVLTECSYTLLRSRSLPNESSSQAALPGMTTPMNSIVAPFCPMAAPFNADNLRIHRRSSGERFSSSKSSENTPLLSDTSLGENPIPAKVRTPKRRPGKNAQKHEQVLHDRSGRHNIPSVLMSDIDNAASFAKPDAIAAPMPQSPSRQHCPMDEDPISPQKMDASS